jgi:ketosteroid isomerase-like protein
MNGLLKVVAILSVSWLPLVTGPGLPTSAAGAEPDVKSVDTSLYDAIAARDALKVADILDDGFLLTNTFGEMYDKKKFLTACCTGSTASKTLFLGASDTQVKTFGDTAIIFARTDMRFVRDNQDQKLAWRSIRVYVRTSGRWKLAAEQRTAIG